MLAVAEKPSWVPTNGREGREGNNANEGEGKGEGKGKGRWTGKGRDRQEEREEDWMAKLLELSDGANQVEEGRTKKKK